MIGRYRVERRLASGGMGDVFVAYDPRLRRKVVVKLLRRGDDALLQRWFEREAQILAELGTVLHTPIVPVLDMGRHDDRPYLVMHYLDGGTLSDRLRDGGKMSVFELEPIVRRIGEALQAAHDKGIVHRDVKPANILFDSAGNAFLADFGIAYLQAVTQMTAENDSSPGTPPYMAPEQWRGEPVTAQTDIYQLGVVIFRALTGQRPFVSDSRTGYRAAHLEQAAPLLSQVDRRLAGLDLFMRTALAKAARERFDSADLMLNSYSHTIRGQHPILAVPNTQLPNTDYRILITAPLRARSFIRIWASAHALGWSGGVAIAAALLYRSPTDSLLGSAAQSQSPVGYIILAAIMAIIGGLGGAVGGSIGGVLAGMLTKLAIGDALATFSRQGARRVGWLLVVLLWGFLGVSLAHLIGAFTVSDSMFFYVPIPYVIASGVLTIWLFGKLGSVQLGKLLTILGGWVIGGGIAWLIAVGALVLAAPILLLGVGL